mmetsp:Transcript_5447/g.10856  ORF Transcript_5447/g.10856 Transcript_5447/m.10856 type:complete len:221 (+) Transcript_5447:811-1473(+)
MTLESPVHRSVTKAQIEKSVFCVLAQLNTTQSIRSPIPMKLSPAPDLCPSTGDTDKHVGHTTPSQSSVHANRISHAKHKASIQSPFFQARMTRLAPRIVLKTLGATSITKSWSSLSLLLTVATGEVRREVPFSLLLLLLVVLAPVEVRREVPSSPLLLLLLVIGGGTREVPFSILSLLVVVLLLLVIGGATREVPFSILSLLLVLRLLLLASGDAVSVGL